MATSKRSKRPLSLSLSQQSGLESSRSRRRRNISSQRCDTSCSNSNSFAVVREENENPRKKLVEEWLEKNNSDICTENNTESDDGNSQDTELLEGGFQLHNNNQNDRETGQLGKIKEENEDAVQQDLFDGFLDAFSDVEEQFDKDTVVQQELVQDNVIQQIAKDSVVKQEVVEEQVNEGVVESEAGPSHGPMTEEEPLLQCPLCWKNFEKAQTQAAHLKACAAANGLTTRQLIDAVDLHKKQLAERRKIGLFPMAPPPAAPKKSAPKKAEGQTVRKSRKPKDSNLELALALSLSLAQGEERRESLNAYGFTSKSSGAKKSAPVLLTRTQAERERLITEKVAIVLMEEPESSQPSNHSQEGRPTVQSAQLQEWWDEDIPLWKKTLTSPSNIDRNAFYVSALGNVIAPSKAEVGANLRHISQVPGRINTPKKSEKPEEKPAEDSSLSECRSATNTLSLAKLELDVKAKHLSDWASMLKNSSMSDLTIYVRGGMAIPAHKLVFGVRCPQALRDVAKQQNQVTGLHVDVILWPDISNDAAMCFLEYIYYGSIRSIHTLRKDISGLEWLATRYEANDLQDVLTYFDRRKKAVKSLSDALSVRSPTPELQHFSAVASLRSQETVPIVKTLSDSLKSRDEDQDSEDMFEDEEVIPPSEHSIHSQKTVLPERKPQSPDLFSDVYNFALSPSPKQGTSGNSAVTEKNSNAKSESEGSDKTDRLSAGSSAEPKSVCSLGKSTLPRKSSVLSSPQAEKSFAGPSRSPPRDLHVSPLSDLPAFDTGSHYIESRISASQRPTFTDDDDDVVVISDDEERVTITERPRDILLMSDEEGEKDAVPKSQRTRGLLSTSDNDNDEENRTVPVNPRPRDILLLSDEEETVSKSQRTRRLLSSDEEENKSVPENQSPRDFYSLSTNSLKSKSRSPEKNSPYISPVWNGFDDMVYDVDMGQNWNDEPMRETDTPPVQEIDIDMSPVRTRDLEKSPVQEIDIDMSPVRTRELETSPVPKNQHISPLSKAVHDISDSASSCDEPPATGNVSKDLLNDSLNAILASSFLDRLENEHRTPKQNRKRKKKGVDSGRVTPMKNYREMTTPEIKEELQKFGMKPSLGKKKGVIMLEYIYNQLHPLVPKDGSFSLSQPSTSQSTLHRMASSQPCSSTAATAQRLPSSSSSSSSSSAEGLSDGEFDDSDSGSVMTQRGSKTLSATELPGIVTKHIEKDRILHRKILEYEPIFIEHLHSDLKNNGYKFKVADLMAYLGKKCINYRSAKVSARTRKRTNQNGNKRKKHRPNPESDLDLLNLNGGLS